MTYAFFLLVLTGIVGVSYFLTPKRMVVHAARAKPLTKNSTNRWLLAGFVRGSDGRRIKVRNKFLGRADGDSMAKFGIKNGSSFIADRLSEEDVRSLKKFDIVVVHGPAKASSTGYRLRRIDRIEDDAVKFLPDGNDEHHRDRGVADVKARVKYVV
tara:strand:+ start:8506 stop:8973 length:468 start_codon:yes stop_codon:yes gene_type:complete